MKTALTLFFFFAISVKSYYSPCIDTVIISPNEFVDFVGVEEYQSCDKLVTATIKEGIILIGSHAFYNCNNLKNLALPKSLKIIKQSAFQLCTSLETVTIPEGVTVLEGGAFRSCKSLKSVFLPSTLQSIGVVAFQEQASLLTQISFPNGNPIFRASSNGLCIFTIKGELFMCSNAATSIDIDPKYFDNVEITKFYTHSFACCDLIRNIIIPTSVTTIESRAFYAMRSLISLFIGPSINYFEPTTLDECMNLKQIDVDVNSKYYSSVDGVLFSKNKETLVIYPILKESTTFTIPKETKTFLISSFYLVMYLQNFNVDPENTALKTINGIVFSKNGETIIKVPPSRTTVDLNSFGTNIITIESYSFYSCKIKEITIPQSVKYIKSQAFMFSQLIDVTIPETVEFLGEGIFCFSVTGTATIKCKITAIPRNAFLLSNVQKIVLPDSIVNFSESCFHSCRVLTSVNIPSNLKFIGKASFYFCAKLPDLTFPESLEHISESAFESCITFRQVTIPKNVKMIEDYAFSTCNKVVSVKFMSCNTQYKKNTFYSIPNFDKPVCVATKTFTSPALFGINNQKAKVMRFFLLLGLINE